MSRSRRKDCWFNFCTNILLQKLYIMLVDDAYIFIYCHIYFPRAWRYNLTYRIICLSCITFPLFILFCFTDSVCWSYLLTWHLPYSCLVKINNPNRSSKPNWTLKITISLLGKHGGTADSTLYCFSLFRRTHRHGKHLTRILTTGKYLPELPIISIVHTISIDNVSKYWLKNIDKQCITVL